MTFGYVAARHIAATAEPAGSEGFAAAQAG
jgi:hypothetical protein